MTATAAPAAKGTPSTSAYQILRLGYTVVPILFGIDKFFNLMTDWREFLPEFLTEAVSGTVVMAIVGLVEITAGVGVWMRPKLFAYVVAAWLGVIIITLIIAGGFWDIALRDFGLLLGALALGQLARQHA